MNILQSIAESTIGFITMNSRMNKQEKEMKEIKTNYLQQFKEVRADIASSKTETHDMINYMHRDIIDRVNKK